MVGNQIIETYCLSTPPLCSGIQPSRAHDYGLCCFPRHQKVVNVISAPVGAHCNGSVVFLDIRKR